VTDVGTIRRAIVDASDDVLEALAFEVRKALEGDSNDAEHDALVSAAAVLGIDWGE
jgi:hypothetical protein